MTLSPSAYNGRVGPALFCLIASQVKGYPFEVVLPDSSAISGVALVDQIKSLDWRARRAEFIDGLPESTLREALAKVRTLL